MKQLEEPKGPPAIDARTVRPLAQEPGMSGTQGCSSVSGTLIAPHEVGGCALSLYPVDLVILGSRPLCCSFITS